nr:zinc finger, CCHC-type [Tanacetum cinerariifolium]
EATNEKKENTAMAMIFQTLPRDVLMQVAQYLTAKEVWDSIKVKYLGADLVQKARLQTLRSELEMLRMKPNEKVSDYGGKLSSIKAKFEGLGETLEDKLKVPIHRSEDHVVFGETSLSFALSVSHFRVDGQEAAGTDGRAVVDRNVSPFPNVDDVELHIPQ